MGASKVAFVDASCGCSASSSLHFDGRHQLHSHQPALSRTGRLDQSYVPYTQGTERAQTFQRVVATGGERNWPSSELLLAEKPGAEAQESGRADAGTPSGGKQETEEGSAVGWLGQPSLHQELGAIIASHQNGQQVHSYSKRTLTVPPEPPYETKKSVGLASLQNRKRLSKEKGLLGFERVEEKTAAANHAAAAKPARPRQDATQDVSGSRASMALEATNEPRAQTRKGGTKLIRPKRKDDSKRFQAFLSQRAPVVDLPPSEHIPLAPMGFPAVARSNAPSKSQSGGAESRAVPELAASRGGSSEPLVSAPPGCPSVHPREELSRKITWFTSRLFKAVAASESTQEIWPRFQESGRSKARLPKLATNVEKDLGSASARVMEEGLANGSETRSVKTGVEVALKIRSKAEGAPKADAETASSGSALNSVVAEEHADPEAEDPHSVSDLEDQVVGKRLAGGVQSAEPPFPYWLAGNKNAATLLTDAETSASEVDHSRLKKEEALEHVEESSGESDGRFQLFVEEGNGAYRPDPTGNPPAGPQSAEQQHGAFPRGARMVIDLRASTEGIGGSHLDLEWSSGTTDVPQAPPAAVQEQRMSDPVKQIRSSPDTAVPEDQSGRPVGRAKKRRRRRFPNLLQWIREDPKAKPEAPPSLELNYPDRSTFAEIVAGDKRALGSAVAYSRWWVRAWRVPLQSDYDPEIVGDYFGRRPHLVLSRLLQIGSAALSAGLPSLVDLAKVPSNPDAGGQSPVSERRGAIRKAAVRLKSELVGLGPTFIKAAQSMSSRPDIVGEETAAVLSELQDRLPPFSSAAAMAVIQSELGRPVGEVFSELSDTPVAAASFGQVYKGRTHSGDTVAVKVQRPDVLRSVALDMHILRSLLQGVRKIARVTSDLRLLADELGRGLYGELDYRAEAANAELFAASQQQLPYVAVPRVLHAYSSRRVLTMEWIEGDRPVDLLAAADARSSAEGPSKARTKLLSLVSMGIESSLVQLLETGVMHSDPHPGNLLLRADGKLVYLDFGLMTRIPPSHRGAMLSAIAHLVHAEWAALTDDLDALDVLKPTNDKAEVAAALAEAFGGGAQPLITGSGVPRVRFGEVAAKLWGIALRFRFKLPPYFTLVLRNLASLEGIGLSANPSFKVFASAYPHVLRRVLTENTPVTRRVLRTLITDGKGSLRWDRLAALVEARAKRNAGTAEAASAASSSDVSAPSGLSSRAPEIVLGRSGAGVRRVLLQMDLVRFARDFSSPAAAPIRILLAAAAADALDRTLFGSPRDQTSIPHSNPSPSVLSSGPEGPTLDSATFASSSPCPTGQIVLVADDSTTSADAVAGFVVHAPAHRRWENGVSPELERRVLRKRLWLLVKLIAAKAPKELAAKLRVLRTALLFAGAVMRGVVARAWRRLLAAVQGLSLNGHTLEGQSAT